MVGFGRLATWLTLAVGSLTATAEPAAAIRPWMTEEAMRAAFIGNTLDGHYVDGLKWTETYSSEGRLDYRESIRKGQGYWYFRGQVFCTFYDPGFGLSGGCWTTIQASSNCYEFYVAGLREPDADDQSLPGPLRGWSARAWRKGEPSTCEEKPSV